MKINKGTIVGDEFRKTVNWNKAVLWKDRQISLPEDVFKECRERGVNRLIFTDSVSNQQHIFYFPTIAEESTLKKEGQEPQHYWSIDLERRIKDKEKVKKCWHSFTKFMTTSGDEVKFCKKWSLSIVRLELTHS